MTFGGGDTIELAVFYLRLIKQWRPTLALKGRIIIDRDRCKGCHICMEFCPMGLISVASEANRKGYQPARFEEQRADDKKTCTGCASCATVCPEIAIEVYRER